MKIVLKTWLLVMGIGSLLMALVLATFTEKLTETLIGLLIAAICFGSVLIAAAIEKR